MSFKNQGFSLIECTAYLAGLMFLAYLVAQFTQVIMVGMMADVVKQRNQTQLSHAVQLLSRDIRAANPERNYWTVGTNSLLLHHDASPIRWEISNGWLYRRRGNDPKARQCEIQAFTCELVEHNGLVRAVKIVEPIERNVTVMNGPIS